ncbi:wsv290 [White spot syndrome virus]|uniref:Wsv290 n=5 Tax=White spot syndrome virus TaxID=342409 RepID=Q8VAU4_WSSVS|nr:wsv290 [Shrimp white spot syndrome virus]AFX59666.1 wsv290 [White spot syndrome virus]AAL33292.1 wsv290 [Shrimp white spot syndrome virus]AAL89213.1 WSSV345 [Shrimp white spot syndrome virus]AWQ60866.1 wsv290 [Shrimp white spot syndrome virus]AWQ61283.1 wsv290 [Shrimp white spot syndrome virus]
MTIAESLVAVSMMEIQLSHCMSVRIWRGLTGTNRFCAGEKFKSSGILLRLILSLVCFHGIGFCAFEAIKYDGILLYFFSVSEMFVFIRSFLPSSLM